MAKRGRKLKYETPEDFEKAAMRVLEDCKADDGPVPTVLWLEYKMDVDFYRYLERKEFCDTVTRIKKIAAALYEQKANRRIIDPKIAAMKLAHEDEYAPLVQKVDMKSEATINSKTFDDLFKKAQALTPSVKDNLIAELRSIVHSGEGES